MRGCLMSAGLIQCERGVMTARRDRAILAILQSTCRPRNTVPVNLQAYAILCITTLIWGGNSVAGKMAVGHVSPMMLTSLRWVVACTVLLIFAAPQVAATCR